MDEKYWEQAEALTRALVDNGVEKIQASIKKRDPSFDGYCNDCGDQIPEARLDTGATECLDCRQRQEFLDKQFRR